VRTRALPLANWLSLVPYRLGLNWTFAYLNWPHGGNGWMPFALSSALRPPSSEVERLVSSPRLADESLGWQSHVDLDEGLRRTIEWIVANHRWFRVDHFVI
jgi:nucleoside-diphosphate-sugar epimerase